MITKGVASVRSPVCNLQQFSPTISHETFSDAVVRAFQEEYNIDQEVNLFCLSVTICTLKWLKPYVAQEDEGMTNIEYIREGMAELPVRIKYTHRVLSGW
jgi:lipoate-protein ligase A